jgi:predicted nucleotidyltransferase
MESNQQIFSRLKDNGVEFVVIGGMAAILHGSVRVTLDLDICAPLVEPNLSKILAALDGTHPRWRMRPDKLPLATDPERLRGFKHFYLDTDLGTLDILSEVIGIGTFEDALRHSVTMDFGGFTGNVLDLDSLIIAKRAAGRRKDLDAVIELELIRDTIRRRRDG